MALSRLKIVPEQIVKKYPNAPEVDTYEKPGNIEIELGNNPFVRINMYQWADETLAPDSNKKFGIYQIYLRPEGDPEKDGEVTEEKKEEFRTMVKSLNYAGLYKAAKQQEIYKEAIEV